MNNPANAPLQQNGVPAATIIIFRKGAPAGPPEILMTIRAKNMTFAGGMAVFPGGRVDPADYELGRQLGGDLEPDEAANQIAAVRETLEETGLVIGIAGQVDGTIARAARALLLETRALAPVLTEFGWTLDLDQLTPFARWFPKNERLPRVFDTRFYLADLGTGAVEIAADLSENTHLFWITAQDALESDRKGDLKLIFPTRRNLERLAQFGNFADVKAHAESIPVQVITPSIVRKGGKRWISIGEDLGYPVTEEEFESNKRD